MPAIDARTKLSISQHPPGVRVHNNNYLNEFSTKTTKTTQFFGSLSRMIYSINDGLNTFTTIVSIKSVSIIIIVVSLSNDDLRTSNFRNSTFGSKFLLVVRKGYRRLRSEFQKNKLFWRHKKLSTNQKVPQNNVHFPLNYYWWRTKSFAFCAPLWCDSLDSI